jgi:hypothetical protein
MKVNAQMKGERRECGRYYGRLIAQEWYIFFCGRLVTTYFLPKQIWLEKE